VTIVTVQRDVDGHPLAAQPARYRIGKGLFVLNYQNPHSTTVP
jgi:hypothetical protein